MFKINCFLLNLNEDCGYPSQNLDSSIQNNAQETEKSKGERVVNEDVLT